jgi:hypothetical protein
VNELPDFQLDVDPSDRFGDRAAAIEILRSLVGEPISIQTDGNFSHRHGTLAAFHEDEGVLELSNGKRTRIALDGAFVSEYALRCGPLASFDGERRISVYRDEGDPEAEQREAARAAWQEWLASREGQLWQEAQDLEQAGLDRAIVWRDRIEDARAIIGGTYSTIVIVGSWIVFLLGIWHALS